MKIGILTRRYGFNMGSTLQAYAIARMVKDLGHDVEIINYDESSAHWRWKIRPFAENILYTFKTILPTPKREYLNHRHSQIRRFQKFESDYFPLSNCLIRSSRELDQSSDNYEKIIVGSDQIWNPFLYDPNYIGGFLCERKRDKIIAYAPSIGTTDLDLITIEQQTLIKSLSNLSCRENEGAELIKCITGKDIPVVLDPTLMLDSDEWNRIAKSHPINNIPPKYVLTYFLGKSAANDVISKRARELNTSVVNVNMFNKPNDVIADFHMKDIGPGEFLNLIKNATHIFTDSFHATVFSWIFNREFTVFERFKSSEKNNQNSRIYTLLKIIGNESCLYDNDSTDSIPSIQEKRLSSIEYLKKAISK